MQGALAAVVLLASYAVTGTRHADGLAAVLVIGEAIGLHLNFYASPSHPESSRTCWPAC
jgi:hypothetical protein